MRRRWAAGILGAGLLLSAPVGGPRAQSAPEAGAVTKLSRLQGSAFLGRNRQVVGATVLVTPADKRSRLFVTSSDSKGRFRVDDLPDGDYRVEVRREGLQTVVKEGVGLRFPTRAVIEVTMHPSDRSSVAAVAPSGEEVGKASRVHVRGEIVEREGQPMPDVVLRWVRVDGGADPVVVRSGEGGAFDLPPLPAGAWRLQTRVVGFLPIWANLELREDTTVSVAMVHQPAGYLPSPLELMPPEQPVAPRRALAPPPAPPPAEATPEAAADETPEVEDSAALEPADS